MPHLLSNELMTNKAFALQQLKFRLNLDITTNFVCEAGECTSNFIVSYVCVAARARRRACVKLKLAPNVHASDALVGSHPYLK